MLRTLSKPVVAAVHGAAIGGGAAFAICCDMVVVGTNLKFGYPELKHHLTPTGVSTSLLKQVGPKAAFEMISLGAKFTADDVMRLGLANRAVAPEAVLPTAIEIAKAWSENDRGPARSDQEHVLPDDSSCRSKAGLRSARTCRRRCGQGLRRNRTPLFRGGARKCALSRKGA